MTRKDFLTLIGAGSGALFVGSCLSGCKKTSDSTTGPSSVDFTLDLTNTAYAVLLANGGYVVHSGVIVARTLAGAYIAASDSCTHEGASLAFQGSSSRFYCSRHGATFATDGSVTNGPATRSIATYNTQLTGTSLRVYSS